MATEYRRTHYRHKSFTAKHEHRKLHALQHHQYLLSLQKNNSLFPRYDIFSENNHNNLIVHVRQDPKEELKPKKTSFLVSKLQQKIQNSTQPPAIEKTTKNKFYPKDKSTRSQQMGLTTPIPKEVPSFITYEQAEDKALSMQNKLKMLYLSSRASYKIKKTQLWQKEASSHL